MTVLLQSFRRYARGQWGRVAVSVGLSLVQVALLVPVAATVQDIFDRALPERDAYGLAWRALLIPLLFAASGAATMLNRHVSLLAVKASVQALRADLLGRAVAWNPEASARTDAATTHARIVQDTERADVMASAALSQFVPGAVVSLALSVALAWRNPTLFLLLLVALPIGAYANARVGRVLARRARTFHADMAAFSKRALFALQYAELIATSAAEEPERARQRANVGALRASSHAMALWQTAYGVVQSNVLVIVGAAVLLVGGRQAIDGTVSVGSLLSFYVHLNLLNANLRGALGAVPAIVEGREALAALRPLVTDEGGSPTKPAFGGLRERLTFEGVGYRHADSSFALRDVSFTVNRGELFGIAGPSGSGKTTLVRLLTGLSRPENGRIRVDGTDIGAVDGTGYRSRIGVLHQHPLIVPGTVRENLTYGLGSVDDARVREVCRLCHVDWFADGIDRGLDGDVGDFGAALSGGQRQRLALARALLRAPDLLILDEPDNNLDADMVADMIGSIRALPITVILISHDERLLALADRQYRLV